MLCFHPHEMSKIDKYIEIESKLTVVVISFVCQLDWAKGYPDNWQSLFLGVSMRVLMEEIRFWISRPNKEDCPHQCGGLFQSVKNLNRIKKVKEGQICSLFKLIDLSSPILRHQSSDFQTLRFGLELHHQLSWASILQMADYGTWQTP